MGYFSSHMPESLCSPLSLSFINTLAVICIAFTKHRPSLISLFSTIFLTSGGYIDKLTSSLGIKCKVFCFGYHI